MSSKKEKLCCNHYSIVEFALLTPVDVSQVPNHLNSSFTGAVKEKLMGTCIFVCEDDDSVCVWVGKGPCVWAGGVLLITASGVGSFVAWLSISRFLKLWYQDKKGG